MITDSERIKHYQEEILPLFNNYEFKSVEFDDEIINFITFKNGYSLPNTDIVKGLTLKFNNAYWITIILENKMPIQYYKVKGAKITGIIVLDIYRLKEYVDELYNLECPFVKFKEEYDKIMAHSYRSLENIHELEFYQNSASTVVSV